MCPTLQPSGDITLETATKHDGLSHMDSEWTTSDCYCHLTQFTVASKEKKKVPKDCVLERKGKLIILGRNGIMFSEGQRSFIINGKNNRHMSRGQLSSGLSLRGKALGQKRSS